VHLGSVLMAGEEAASCAVLSSDYRTSDELITAIETVNQARMKRLAQNMRDIPDAERKNFVRVTKEFVCAH
jgi:hypothetical protein